MPMDLSMPNARPCGVGAVWRRSRGQLTAAGSMASEVRVRRVVIEFRGCCGLMGAPRGRRAAWHEPGGRRRAARCEPTLAERMAVMSSGSLPSGSHFGGSVSRRSSLNASWASTSSPVSFAVCEMRMSRCCS